MTSFIEYEVLGTKAAGERITLIGANAQDLKPAFALIRELIIEGHKRQFESQGSFLGTPWPPLAPSTQARKAREGLSSDPLEATEALRTALFGGTGRSTSVTRSAVRVGVGKRVFYGLFAGKGTKYQPARPITGMSATEGQEALDILERFVMRGV